MKPLAWPVEARHSQRGEVCLGAGTVSEIPYEMIERRNNLKGPFSPSNHGKINFLIGGKRSEGGL